MQHWILKWCRCFFQAIDGRSREKPWTKDEFLTAAVVVAGTGLPTSATCHTSTPTIAAALAKKVPLFHQFLNFGGAHEQRHAYLYWRKCWLVMNAQWKREKKPHLGGAGRTWEHLLIPARNSHHHHKTREHASKQCNHIQRRFFRSSIFLFLYLVNRKFGSIFEKKWITYGIGMKMKWAFKSLLFLDTNGA